MSIQTKKVLKRVTVNKILKMKGREKIVMVTAYDALFAKLFNESVDMILVGDSLNMSFLGERDTLSATVEQMIYHTRAVSRGADLPLIVFDMPFGSYTNEIDAVRNGSRVYQETDAQAVKVEGGRDRANVIEALTKNSIAVLGHIGLMPQFLRSDGGYRVRGKSEEDIQTLIDDAKAIEDAGAFALVVEGVKEEAGERISEAVSIPTIGIGAGRYTDGQVLVWSDMLGIFEEFKPKFVKRYLNGAELIRGAMDRFVDDVKSERFPSREFIY